MKLELEQVKKFITKHVSENASNISYAGEGEWSKAYSFHLDNDYIIRFGKFKEDFKKDKIASMFSSANLPVPRVTKIGEAFQGYYAISEKMFGISLETLDEEKMKQTIPAVLHMIDAMRKFDLSAQKGYGPWDENGTGTYATWKDYLLDVANDNKSRIQGWSKNMKEAPMGDTSFHKGLKVLEELVKICPEERNLVHTDLLNKNVFVSENKISGVIDWGNAMYGDFLYDLASFSYWSHWYPAMKYINWGEEAKKYFSRIGVEIPNLEKRIRCYELYIGLDALVYNAFTKRWDEFDFNTKRILDLISQQTGSNS